MTTHGGFENSLRSVENRTTPIRFSTEDLPERDRTALWREVIGRNVVRLDLEPLSGRPLRSDVSVHALPGLTMMRGNISEHKIARTRELITDGNNDFRLEVRLSGREHMTQRGREVALDEGEAALVSCSEEVVALQSPGLFLGLHIPHADLTALVPNAENTVMRRIPRDLPALRLLVNYVGCIHQQGDLATPELHRSVVSHIRELVALSIAAASDVAKPDGFSGARAALLRAVKAHVVENLAHPDLSIDWLASRHRLHPRYIQRLFQREGTTFSQFVLEQRLARACCFLTAPRQGEPTIGAIAYACGFKDQSYFNRRFRQRYGLAPSELRESNRRDS
jgi:AraC-like DNA-binding protein